MVVFPGGMIYKIIIIIIMSPSQHRSLHWSKDTPIHKNTPHSYETPHIPSPPPPTTPIFSAFRPDGNVSLRRFKLQTAPPPPQFPLDSRYQPSSPWPGYRYFRWDHRGFF